MRRSSSRTRAVGIGCLLVACCGTEQLANTLPDAAPDVRIRDSGRDVIVADSSDAASPPLVCDPPPPDTIFCTQFEEDGGNPGVGWTFTRVDYGTVTFDTSSFVSPVRSYRATAKLHDSGFPIAAAILIYTIPNGSSYKTISLRVMMRVHQMGERVNLIQLGYPTGKNTQDLAVIATDGANLYLTAMVSDIPSTDNVTNIDRDVWTELRLDLSPPPAAPNVSMYVNGVLVDSVAPAFNPPSTPERDAVVGVEASGKAEDIVEYDDFLLRGLN